MRQLVRRAQNPIPMAWRSSPIWRFLSACRAKWVVNWHGFKFRCALLARTARLLLLTAGLPLKRQFLTLRCMEGSEATGLFSEFAVVLGSLEHYERWLPRYAGLRVDFGAGGLYYEPAFGPNWWEYHFEPIAIGSDEGAISSTIGPLLYNRFADQGEQISRKRGFEIIDRWIRPKPHIHQKVDAYVIKNFGDCFVIGVHYRCTDKFEEAPRVPYEEICAAIQRVADSVADSRYKVFVATDEKAFLSYLLDFYPDRILFREMYRSADGRPIDVVNEEGNHKKGEDAVIDCLLLSRCQYLVRTASTLSLCSTLFNPDLPQVLLNRPYG